MGYGFSRCLRPQTEHRPPSIINQSKSKSSNKRVTGLTTRSHNTRVSKRYMARTSRQLSPPHYRPHKPPYRQNLHFRSNHHTQTCLCWAPAEHIVRRASAQEAGRSPKTPPLLEQRLEFGTVPVGGGESARARNVCARGPSRWMTT